MELYEAIQKRRTVRDFSTKRVPDDVLNRILEAGVKAPSHDHARDWHFVVLRDPKRIAEVLKHVNSGADRHHQSLGDGDGMPEVHVLRCTSEAGEDAFAKPVPDSAALSGRNRSDGAARHQFPEFIRIDLVPDSEYPAGRDRRRPELCIAHSDHE